MTTVGALTSANTSPILNPETQLSASSRSEVAPIEMAVDDFVVMDEPVSVETAFRADDVDDEWTLSDVDAGSSEAPAAAQGTRSTFLPSNQGLNNTLAHELDVFSNQPTSFFGLIAKNTNPNRISYVFQNIISAIADFLSGKKVDTVVERNCVHCTQAVDKTLAQFTSGPAGPDTRLYQVGNPGKGEFMGITSSSGTEARVRALTHQDDALEILKNAVLSDGEDVASTDGKPKDLTSDHKRACFSIPVRGQPYSHAMNYVHYNDNKSFVICGQTGTVYNLALSTDRDLFNAHYGVAESEGSPRVLQVLVTGAAPREFPLQQGGDPGVSHLRV